VEVGAIIIGPVDLKVKGKNDLAMIFVRVYIVYYDGREGM
jgi:hypothetical protein